MPAAHPGSGQKPANQLVSPTRERQLSPHLFSTNLKSSQLKDSSPIFALHSPENLFTKLLASSQFMQPTSSSMPHGLPEREERSSRQLNPFTRERDHSLFSENRRNCKGLKTLSCRVKHIVNGKKKTSYKEVAEQLIAETKTPGVILSVGGVSGQSREEQNIKRRVYDALNVLIAADILVKDNKVVYYRVFYDTQKPKQVKDAPKQPGTDAGALKRDALLRELKRKKEQVEEKKELLRSLMVKGFAVDDILKRNAANPQANQKLVSLPFIMVCAKPCAQKSVAAGNEMMYITTKDLKQCVIMGKSPFSVHTDLDVINMLDESQYSIDSFVTRIKTHFPAHQRDFVSSLGSDCLKKHFQ